MPGMQVLHVALMRLLKCEVGKAIGRHVISLLVDLQCFYDSVTLAQLLELWEPLDFPPAVLNAVYEIQDLACFRLNRSRPDQFTARRAS